MVVLQNMQKHIQYPCFSVPFRQTESVYLIQAPFFVSLNRLFRRKDKYAFYGKMAVHNR